MAGKITPADFLDLNANVGSWKQSSEMVQEGCPFDGRPSAPGGIDVWSPRNMNLSPDGGATPAPRREGNLRGDARRLPQRDGVPRQHRHPAHRLAQLPRAPLNMHNSRQSFASRARMLELRRRRVEPDDLVHRHASDRHRSTRRRWRSRSWTNGWGTSLRIPSGAWPRTSRRGCRLLLRRDGALIASGKRRLGRDPRRRAGRGLHDGRSRPTRRRGSVAGGPMRAEHLQVSAAAGRRGDRPRPLRRRGSPRRDDVARLNTIFPTGVCDYRKGDAGRPKHLN